MEIVIVFVFIALALALATNETSEIRNGFDADDDYDL
jgi:hypothetical protein